MYVGIYNGIDKAIGYARRFDFIQLNIGPIEATILDSEINTLWSQNL